MKKSIDQLKKIVDQHKSDKTNWLNLWQDIGDYIFPRKNNVLTVRSVGEDKQVDLYDNTGPHSLELFAGIMMSILMSVEEQWFEHSTGDVDLDNKDHIKKYLQMVTRTVHNVMANSNFYNEAHELLLDLGSFGTGVFGIEEDPEDVVRFFAKFIAEAHIGENAQGKVDELYMEYEWTADQIAKEYGSDNLPKDVKTALEKNEQKKFKVLHAIYPVDKERLTPNNKGHRFYSHHVMLDEKHELKLGGFSSFPYPTPRFSKATGEKYGRSPGMVALPEVKVLNKMVEITLIGAEKVIDPPLQAPDDGFITQINTFPGGISFYRSGGNDTIKPVFNDARVDFGFQMIQEKQSKIRDAFYINQMQVQQKSGNPATAYEISQQVAQSTRFMGPFMARMQKEFLQPTVDRVTELCFKKGILKTSDIPKELQGKKFSVRYTSFIAKAQRNGTLQDIMRFWQTITPVVNADPTTRHYINGGGSIKTIANLLAVPVEILNDDKKVQQLREQEQAQMQQAQAAEAQQAQMDQAQQAADMAKMMQEG